MARATIHGAALSDGVRAARRRSIRLRVGASGTDGRGRRELGDLGDGVHGSGYRGRSRTGRTPPGAAEPPRRPHRPARGTGKPERTPGPTRQGAS